ncbi:MULTISPECIES: hypothetical protein [Methylocaldum]|jgi:hypothetical protein|uniref:hypothetical protein n=1 Tax=unclassified Methylocaldum TaxID=2622260 RepID=UPI00098ABFEA|nr:MULTISPECIES: hypothetical protein [unclassified Methylocaldum]MBP1149196.1 hypothetical protein [Methylocaldum sp. RMAD-M]MVF20383.1 hypothetical protein [Methylocaldum sp. BRCS4]
MADETSNLIDLQALRTKRLAERRKDKSRLQERFGREFLLDLFWYEHEREPASAAELEQFLEARGLPTMTDSALFRGWLMRRLREDA